ncbi:MAG TPA: amidohydrolase family protein [Polyangiaceae bacterium]|jgi:hypothetical protein
MRGVLGCALAVLLVACGGGKNAGSGTGGDGDDEGGAPDGGQSATQDGGQGAVVGTPLAGAAGCGLVSQGTSGLVLRATLLVPGGPLDGEVLVDGTGAIACVGASCASAPGYGAATQIACTSAVVSPGFVNAHDHTDYDWTPPTKDAHGTVRYQHRNEWRTGADGATPLPYADYTDDPATLAAGELRFVMSGVTTLVGSGGIAGLTRNLALSSYSTGTTEGLTGSTVNFDTFPLGDSKGTILSSGCGYPAIATPAQAFGGYGVFAPHFAEGINAGAENELVCASSAALGLVTSHTTILHAVGVDAKDVAAIAAAKANVVWAPRSNVSLYGDTMPITEMKYAGVPVSLGTDWLPTGSMNILRELACADTLNTKYFGGAFDDPSLVAMATQNAATAMGFGSQIGSITKGMAADLVVFATTGTKGWRTPIEAASEDVALVLRGGKALYGDAALVQAAGGSGCDAIDVCGTSKAVCIDSPGISLAAMQSASASTYPLFFCRGQIPTGEPTCTPYRDGYPNGTSATDRDGDGVADASDDCPDVFNPPRSMDGDQQSDVDGDGVGDACDAKPLDASAH